MKTSFPKPLNLPWQIFSDENTICLSNHVGQLPIAKVNSEGRVFPQNVFGAVGDLEDLALSSCLLP